MICDCGHEAIPDGISTGYGINGDGKTHCYQCCSDLDRKALEAGDSKGKNSYRGTALYFVNHEGSKWVSNWVGLLKFLPYLVRTQKVWNNFAGRIERNDVWFHVGKNHYHGYCLGQTQLLTVRKVKP